MITCNYCGYNTPDGAYNCPKCGVPLSTRMESGTSPRMGGQEQADIPAWLETLRVGERPAAPTSNSTNFSASDLIEDGALPNWMRSARSDAPNPSVSDAFNALHPASGSSPMLDQGSIPPRGINAQSLIDEKALPPWMHEEPSSTSTVSSSGFDASSLVDAGALPDWMRSLQPPQSPAQNLPQSAQPIPDALPDWMRSLQPPQSPAQRSQPARIAPETESNWMKPMQPSLPSTPLSEPVVPSSTGFSARELLDEQSLPSWMTQQSGQSAVSGNGQPGHPGSLSPSSLIDQNALPNWMRESEKAPLNAPAPSVQPSPLWQASVQSPMQAPLAQNAPGQNSGLAGPSFIDMNSLPEWLRSGAMQPSSAMSQQPDPSRMGAYSGPPRVDNMRVPSRPRGEVNPNEGNEVAANVFASMLGVASSAPQFSTPPSAPYGQQQPNLSPQGPQQVPPAGMPGQVPVYNAGMSQQGPIPNNGIPGMSQQSYTTGNYGVGYGERSSIGVPSSGAMPPQPPYNSTLSSTPSASSQADDQKTSKKRGLVDTLLGWLLH